MPGLFEEFAVKAFAREMETEKNLWTSKYYDGQIVYLKTNFSEKRLRHLIDVREVLRTQEVDGFKARPAK